MFRLFILMFLTHLIDEFVFQPVSLGRLKLKSYWEHKQADGHTTNDYAMALVLHACSWSIMILVPIMMYTDISDIFLLTAFLVNMFIHAMADEYRDNQHKLSFVTVQGIFFIQVAVTCITAFLIEFCRNNLILS